MTRTQRTASEVAAVLLASTAVAVLITWPLAIHLSSSVLGGTGTATDVTGYWWDIWNNSRNGLDVWGPAVQDQIGAPFGRPIVGAGNLLLLVFTGPAWILAAFLPAALVLNLLTLLALVLSGSAMYLLVRWLGLGPGPAAWAGLAFQIAPYELLRASGHPPLAIVWWLPLLLMAAVYWIRVSSWRSSMLLAAVTLLAWLTNPYYGAMAMVVVAVVLLVGTVLIGRRAHSIRHAGAALFRPVVALTAIVGIPILLAIRSSAGATEAVTRQRIELELYGARFWDYVIPPPGTQLGNALGGSEGLSPSLSPGGERTVFLGWVVIALLVAGTWLIWRRWAALGAAQRIAVAVALPTALAAGIMSLASPTRIAGLEITTPSSLVFDALPYLRAYARFGVVVLACAVVLAAVALFLILRGGSRLWRYSWIAAVVTLTAVEMPLGFPVASGPPVTIAGQQIEDVATWRWLRDKAGPGTVIEVPAFTSEALDRYYMAGQIVHGRAIANGGLNERNAAADFTDFFGDPLMPRAASAYATAGIRYVALEPWAYDLLNQPAPDVARPPAGYRVAADLGPAGGVWQVTAQPQMAVAFPLRQTWDTPAPGGIPGWRTMHGESAMRVWNPGPPGTGIVSFLASPESAGSGSRLVVRLPGMTEKAFPLESARRIRFRARLPNGLSSFTLSSMGSAAVSISPWTIEAA